MTWSEVNSIGSGNPAPGHNCWRVVWRAVEEERGHTARVILTQKGIMEDRVVCGRGWARPEPIPTPLPYRFGYSQGT